MGSGEVLVGDECIFAELEAKLEHLKQWLQILCSVECAGSDKCESREFSGPSTSAVLLSKL